MYHEFITSKGITLNAYGTACAEYACERVEDVKELDCFTDAKKLSDAVFVHVNQLLKLRQSHGVNAEELKARTDLFRQNLMALYAMVGERKNGNRKVNAISFTDEKQGEQTADAVVIGQILSEVVAQKLDEKAAFVAFFHALTLYIGNVLCGNGKRFVDLKEVRKKDMAAAKKANREKAAKAKETREKNERLKKESDALKEAEKAHVEAIEKELATMRKNAINIVELVARINATSATDAEKKSLVDWIMGNDKQVQAV